MPRVKRNGQPIDRYTVMTQAQVGARLGISTMRVCQLEKSALRKLRLAFEEQGYELRQLPVLVQNNALVAIARHEREQWMWRLLLADCDLNDSPVARSWKAQ